MVIKEKEMTFFSIKKVLLIIIIIIFLLTVLFPIYWMVSSSLKEETEIHKPSPTWIPKRFTLEHYRDLFARQDFGMYLLNSTIIAVGTTLISIILGLPAAYGFSRYKFRGSNIFLIGILVIRLFTPAALIVPFYDIMSKMGLIDSPFAIIIGVTIINLPFVLWVMKASFDDFPKELEDAAKVDGSSSLRIFMSIVLPCSLPMIATVVLFSFTMGWNDFLFSISFSQSIRSTPATVAISMMITPYRIYWGNLMAGGTFLSIPIVLLTLLLQKYFVKGLILGAIKE